jgi:hypothetical protein
MKMQLAGQVVNDLIATLASLQLHMNLGMQLSRFLGEGESFGEPVGWAKV